MVIQLIASREEKCQKENLDILNDLLKISELKVINRETGIRTPLKTNYFVVLDFASRMKFVEEILEFIFVIYGLENKTYVAAIHTKDDIDKNFFVEKNKKLIHRKYIDRIFEISYIEGLTFQSETHVVTLNNIGIDFTLTMRKCPKNHQTPHNFLNPYVNVTFDFLKNTFSIII
jgi:AAA+ superfamily predicted ATPase